VYLGVCKQIQIQTYEYVVYELYYPKTGGQYYWMGDRISIRIYE